jgi:hypothetical protein
MHALVSQRGLLVGQAFVVLEVAQHPLLRALFGACKRGEMRGFGRGIKLATE